MTSLVDLTNKTFTRLTVIGRNPQNGNAGQPQWDCLCECGGTITVKGADLRSGNTRSCGCLRRERASETKYKGQDITYLSAHFRVRRARGAARDHTCVDCGERATHWSYSGDCPDEKWGPNNKSICAYCPSNHESCYLPRCGPCHGKYDSNQRMRKR